jgi:dTDP-4-amino-4,6-dideoxygalactose transaminase
MKVPFFDLRPQQAPLASQLQHAFASFIDQPRFILGETVERFEAEACEQLQVRHAIGVSSGSDALLCGLLALGVGPGDEVITSPFTFAATAEAIVRVGAVPRFVDIDPDSLNIDVHTAAAAITSRTKALLPVHLFGNPADLAGLTTLAQAHGLAVIEDAAQAWGARFRGQPVGGLGTLGAFSFFPSKPLGAWGDGGLLATQDAELAERCRQLRVHGKNAGGQLLRIGGNFRLDALQAAVLRIKLPHVVRWQHERARIAANYARGLSEHPGLRLPSYPTDAESAYSVYTVRIAAGQRDRVRAALLERGIETAVYYQQPLHLEAVFLEPGAATPVLPHAEQAASEVLSLPIFPGLSEDQQYWVIECLRAICANL